MAKNSMAKMALKKEPKVGKTSKKEYGSMDKKPLSKVSKRKAGKDKM